MSSIGSITLKEDKVRVAGRLSLWVLPFLGVVVFVAHFLNSPDFGLYEDDYFHISRAMGWNLTELFDYAQVLVTWPQGRPVGFFLTATLSFIGSRLGGLLGVYLLAFLIVTLNSYLFYLLLSQRFPQMVALAAALAFCLFPADTTQPLLMHALGLQTSLTFLLLASLSYLSGRRVIAYLLALGALLTYESTFMVFFAVPLLREKWDRSVVFELIRHAMILGAMILVVVIIRVVAGDTRLAMGDGIVGVPAKVLASVFVGPLISMSLFLFAPVLMIRWTVDIVVLATVCAVIFSWIFIKIGMRSVDGEDHYPLRMSSTYFALQGVVHIPRALSGIGKLLIAGMLMLGLAYTLSFTHFPPWAIKGRDTSVHLAATFGGSLIFGCLCFVFLTAARRSRVKMVGPVLLGLYVSLLVGYRLSIQADYKQSWANQIRFWSNVVQSSLDMTDSTIILVAEDSLPETEYIATNSWADPFVLEQVFQIPGEWENPPRAMVVGSDWTSRVRGSGNQMTIPWPLPSESTWEFTLQAGNRHWDFRWDRVFDEVVWEFPLQDANVILLENIGGELVRIDEPITVDNRVLTPRPMEDDAFPSLAGGPLYPYLIEGN